MNNFIQDGKTLTLAAPYDLGSGAGFQVGGIFAIALRGALNGQPVEGVREGVYTLPKTSAQAWAQGDKIYWDVANKRCDTDGTVGMLIGTATVAAANPSASADVLLNGCAPATLEGSQASIADVAAANASDLATAQTLANGLKATVNTLLAELRIAGIIKP